MQPCVRPCVSADSGKGLQAVVQSGGRLSRAWQHRRRRLSPNTSTGLRPKASPAAAPSGRKSAEAAVVIGARI